VILLRVSTPTTATVRALPAWMALAARFMA